MQRPVQRMAELDGRQSLVNQYVAELQDLTFNSKPLINTLTMIASENPQASSGIAEAIERRIASSAPAHKLPALYLLDSIIKNVGLPYTALFARELPRLYITVWLANPDVRPSLTKLYNTWHRFFPADILKTISEHLANPEAAVRQPQQHMTATSQHFQHPNSQSLAPHYYQQYPASSMADAWPQGFTGQQQNQTYAPASQVQQQSVSNQYAAAYTPTYPQPQYAHQSPHNSLADVQADLNSGRTTPTYPPPPQPGVPDILSQLVSAGLIPAGRQGLGAGGVSKPDQKAQSVVMPLVLNLSTAKEWYPTALKQLMEGTQATEPKFLDQRLNKKRKIAAGTKSSRTWFVKTSDWLAGTTADAQAAPAFFDEPEKEEEAPAEAQASVPADPKQPTCSLSGERFETFWDDASNSWRYRDATALDGEQADKYGLPEGTLVKVSCLGPVGETRIDGASEALDTAEGEKTAEEVAAAASEETVRPEPKEGETKDDRSGDVPDEPEEKSPKRQRLS